MRSFYVVDDRLSICIRATRICAIYQTMKWIIVGQNTTQITQSVTHCADERHRNITNVSEQQY